MSNEQSIRDELSETLFKFYDHGTQPNALVEADALLASPVIRRIQAEAWDRCVGEMPIDADWKNFYGDNNPYRGETA